MAMRNIGGDPNDPAYRYKMPRLEAKVEGRGNGIKTRIVNMEDIAKALHRDPAYITKFFGCELGAQTKENSKVSTYIVNGQHDTKELDSKLDLFIQNWVLCKECGLPETDLAVSKGFIYEICNACGKRNRCDMNHRLATYILKSPPKKAQKQKVGAGAKKQQKKIAAEERMAKSATKIKIEEEKEEEEDWAGDTSAEAQKQRAKEVLSEKAKELVALDADEQMLTALRNFINSNPTDKQIKYIKDLEKKECFGSARRAELLFEACFDKNILKQIEKRAALIHHFCNHPRTQRVLIGCIERLVEQHPELMKRIPDIFQGFYDADMLEEDSLMDWFDVPSAKYVPAAVLNEIRKYAKPFIDWLKEADEEGESDDDEEEEVVAPPPSQKKNVSIKLDDDDDDVTLDDL